ncbi:MAG: hypothetical protein L6R41_004818 [Letrouitia leprolyta]|nr:MAG: hypothetical protein L6R41_004818 [Letrouitia leprolyta]
MSAGTARAPGSLRSTSETSSNPPGGSIPPPTIGQPQPIPAQSMPHGPGAMAITSIIEHPMHGGDVAHSARGMNELGQTGIGAMPMSYRPEWMYGAGDSPIYSSDSCSSPMSDYPNVQIPYHAIQSHEGIQRPPSTFSDSSYHQRTIASPLSAGPSFTTAWGTPDPAPTYDGAYVPTVGIRNLDRLQAVSKTNSIPDPSLQLPFSNVDLQHRHLLLQEPPDPSILSGEDHLRLPFPSSSEAWNCPDLSIWRDMIASQQILYLDTVDPSLPPLDRFQSSLRTCYQIYTLERLNNPTENDLTFHPTKCGSLATVTTYHALSFSRHTPLHALIVTASESWLFGSKMTVKEIWQQNRLTVRDWVNSDAATKAVWHATWLLRLSFQNQGQQVHPTDGVSYMHDLWCLYTAALVCWAFGYGTAGMMDVPPEWQSEHAENLAREYLGAMDVQDWWKVGQVPAAARRSTRGLLECVRVRIGEMGLGGLLDGAEDVLFRLVDGESDMVKF